jgi:hypothetical protein
MMLIARSLPAARVFILAVHHAKLYGKSCRGNPRLVHGRESLVLATLFPFFVLLALPLARAAILPLPLVGLVRLLFAPLGCLVALIFAFSLAEIFRCLSHRNEKRGPLWGWRHPG